MFGDYYEVWAIVICQIRLIRLLKLSDRRLSLEKEIGHRLLVWLPNGLRNISDGQILSLLLQMIVDCLRWRDYILHCRQVLCLVAALYLLYQLLRMLGDNYIPLRLHVRFLPLLLCQLDNQFRMRATLLLKLDIEMLTLAHIFFWGASLVYLGLRSLRLVSCDFKFVCAVEDWDVGLLGCVGRVAFQFLFFFILVCQHFLCIIGWWKFWQPDDFGFENFCHITRQIHFWTRFQLTYIQLRLISLSALIFLDGFRLIRLNDTLRNILSRTQRLRLILNHDWWLLLFFMGLQFTRFGFVFVEHSIFISILNFVIFVVFLHDHSRQLFCLVFGGKCFFRFICCNFIWLVMDCMNIGFGISTLILRQILLRKSQFFIIRMRWCIWNECEIWILRVDHSARAAILGISLIAWLLWII